MRIRPLLGLALLLAVVVAAPAYAAGTPVVGRPVGSTPEYLGFSGPFDVDFGSAANGTYACTVEQGGSVVATCSDTFVWNGTGSSQHSFHVPGLAAGSYTFRVHQDPFDNPDVTIDFTVRGYPRPTCSVSVPRAVRMNADEEVVTGRLAANCGAANVTYASWEVDHLTRGFRNWMTFDHKQTDTFSFFGADPLGTYVIAPKTAINAAADDIGQNAPRIDVRLDSRLALRSHRAGSRVTLTATFTKYVPAMKRFGVWKKRAITFSYRTCATCAWHQLAVRRTDAHGHVTFRVRSHKVRSYRVTAAGAELVWAPYPKYSRR